MNPKANIDPEQIKRLRDEGKSVREIAAELGVSIQTVYKYQSMNGSAAPRKPKRIKKSRQFSDGTQLPTAGGFRSEIVLEPPNDPMIPITLVLSVTQIQKLIVLLADFGL